MAAASHSPSFGRPSAISPHRHNAVRQPKAKNMLNEYNHLFKRIETV